MRQSSDNGAVLRNDRDICKKRHVTAAAKIEVIDNTVTTIT